MRRGNDESLAGVDEPSNRFAWRVSEWARTPHLVHGFLGRPQGLGPGAFDLAMIRDRLAEAGEVPRIVVAARQVHGATVVAPDDPVWTTIGWHEGADRLPIGDALVSASADVILTIRTADCVPVLLVAAEARAVAAVHAGWRGVAAGVIEAAVAALGKRYGARPAALSAAIGPAIGGCCYEFGAEHHAELVGRYGPDAETAWRPTEAGRGYLDLPKLVAAVLVRAGLDRAAIHAVDACTAEHPETLHSYRRDGANAGRQISYVGWRA